MLLPYTYLTYRAMLPTFPRWTRRILTGALVLSALMMVTTSSEVGGLVADGQGHKIAQGYGMFLWAGVVLYLATAWRVWVERNDGIVDTIDNVPPGRGPHLPVSHRADRVGPSLTH
jgi:hypothetical protein